MTSRDHAFLSNQVDMGLTPGTVSMGQMGPGMQNRLSHLADSAILVGQALSNPSQGMKVQGNFGYGIGALLNLGAEAFRSVPGGRENTAPAPLMQAQIQPPRPLAWGL